MSDLIDITDTVCLVYVMAITAIGCVCNPLSFVVYSRPTFRNSAASIYFRFLAIVDLGVLFNGFAFKVFQITKDDYSCQAAICSLYIFGYLSSWTLVTVSVERVLAILRPHRVHIWCSPRRAVVNVIAITAIFASLTALFTFTMMREIQIPHATYNETLITFCDFVSETSRLFFRSFDMLFFSVLPSFMLGISSVVIVQGLVASQRRLKKFNSKPQQDDPNSAKNYPTREPDSLRNAGEKKTRTSKETSLKKTLLLVNTTFFLCTLPAGIIFLLPQIENTHDSTTPVYLALQQISLSWIFTNNAMNFFLYCIAGSKFRREAKIVVFTVFSCGSKVSDQNATKTSTKVSEASW